MAFEHVDAIGETVLRKGKVKVLEIPSLVDEITKKLTSVHTVVMGHSHGGDIAIRIALQAQSNICLLYTSPSPRDQRGSRMPSSA